METIADEIRTAMARAFFASAWADMQEEKGPDDPTLVNVSGQEILDLIPDEIDPAAIHVARTLEFDLLHANEWMQSLEMLLDYVQRALPHGGDRPRTAAMLGHYLAMQAMGTGVGLRDA